MNSRDALRKLAKEIRKSEAVETLANARAWADTIEQALAADVVIVPREATREMCRAAVVFANGNAVYKNVAAEVLRIEEDIYAEVWSAMVSAGGQQEKGQ